MTRPFDSGEREPQLKATREKTTAERTDDARRHFFQVWMVIGAAALIYMFGFVLDVLSLPVAIIVWTIVFVLVLRSPVDALERRGVRRGLGTTIAFVGMFAVLAALVRQQSFCVKLASSVPSSSCLVRHPKVPADILL